MHDGACHGQRQRRILFHFVDHLRDAPRCRDAFIGVWLAMLCGLAPPVYRGVYVRQDTAVFMLDRVLKVEISEQEHGFRAAIRRTSFEPLLGLAQVLRRVHILLGRQVAKPNQSLRRDVAPLSSEQSEPATSSYKVDLGAG